MAAYITLLSILRQYHELSIACYGKAVDKSDSIAICSKRRDDISRILVKKDGHAGGLYNIMLFSAGTEPTI